MVRAAWCWWCHSTEVLVCNGRWCLGRLLCVVVKNISWSSEEDFNLARANFGAGGNGGVLRIRGVDGGEGMSAKWCLSYMAIKKLFSSDCNFYFGMNLQRRRRRRRKYKRLCFGYNFCLFCFGALQLFVYGRRLAMAELVFMCWGLFIFVCYFVFRGQRDAECGCVFGDNVAWLLARSPAGSFGRLVVYFAIFLFFLYFFVIAFQFSWTTCEHVTLDLLCY